MVFLGTTFCGGKYTLSPPATPQSTIFTLQIKDGIYNHLFLSTNALIQNGNFEWDYDTVLNADFNEDFSAGNKEFNLQKTDHIILRRREIGKQNWITLYKKEILTVNDFNIHFVDKYTRANADYEYKVSSYLNGVENTAIIENVYSDFDGIYIVDKDSIYGTIYNLDSCDTNRNIAASVQELLNSQYVRVISCSSSNYESGTASGLFIDYNPSTDYLDKKASLQFREDIKNRLASANKKPLVLKIHDGRIWMIKVTGGIKDTNDGHIDLRRVGFDWVEIGDINDMKDLYGWNFIDIESRWW